MSSIDLIKTTRYKNGLFSLGGDKPRREKARFAGGPAAC